MAVSFGSLAQRNKTSRETINRFIDAVPDSAWKILDINLRQHFYSKELIENSLRKCHILKINDEEIAIVAKLFGWDETKELAIANRLLQNYNLRMIVLTKGANGSYVLSHTGETSFQSTPKVHVVDTVGAGDSFTAGFVAALLHGDSIIHAHQLAVEIAAYVCTQQGAMPKLPDTFLK
jgi:fructokinase